MGEQDRAFGDIHKAESLVAPGLFKTLRETTERKRGLRTISCKSDF
jgi:hypothetical protein